ncbi:GntR family transcriptional regulator [Mesorhizobium sp. GR13]|uniref:GntR family transcriptional regulator n=1 Tax=Mesorhizobium sp. GR13 TaxID=2562308 RepID=UPI0010C0A2D8|nr:GntR family transcriptional regulator [Mesorhizobium sp. GR13]
MTVNPIRHPVGNARKPRKPEPIARPAALGELLLKRLRDDIVSGVFALGERLSEEQISRHYGITRAPVRPTLIKLQSEGLLQILPQRGAFVLDPTPEEVRELCELRTALELEAARLALRRNHAALADRIAELIVNMEPYAQDVMNPRYQQFDSEFHLAILEAASSNLLIAAYRQTVHWRFAALRFRLAGDRQHAARSFDEHRAILSLIQNTDIDGLQTALRVHIENTNGYYAALIQGHRGTLTIDATNNKS